MEMHRKKQLESKMKIEIERMVRREKETGTVTQKRDIQTKRR